ncbi:MAG TPA: hypothetical protein VKR52_04490 [Terracidiphilus sp.]|nr:hypothetical protein [Terracidiphilus sp.]
MNKAVVSIGIVVVFLSIIVGWAAFTAGHNEGYVQGTATVQQAIDLASARWVPTSTPPLADILTIQGASTTAQTCFLADNGTCVATYSQFKQLIAYLPLLAAIKGGNILVSSNNVTVPLTATSSASLTDVLTQMVAEINASHQ